MLKLRKSLQKLISFGAVIFIGAVTLEYSSAQTYTPYYYDIGSPTVETLYVDPTSGDDDNDGSSSSKALKTLAAAVALIPKGTPLTKGYQILLRPGTYSASSLPNFWEDLVGTYEHPIIVIPEQGRDSVLLTAPINGKNLHYLYLVNLRIIPMPFLDPLHIELGDHILLRGLYLDGGRTYVGDDGSIAPNSDFSHETLKINQSQYVYVENCNIGGADDNAIDFVSVQYGHVVGNKIQRSGDWCMYNKGGSAYLRIEGNEFAYCGTGGYTAGQGTGFEYMTSPWIHYEAYDLKFINNVIHHVAGAAFGVNGGYNILMAHNTAYSVGSRDHLLEFVFGVRSCDGDAERGGNCSSYHSAGGWGPTQVTSGGNEVSPGAQDPQPIPNKNIYVFNNVIYNPSGVVAGKHFAIYGPRTPASGTNLSSSVAADNNLVIKGNVIWNGSSSVPLGIEESDQGCQSTNATCNATQLTSDNTINTLEPQLNDAVNGDLRPAASSNLLTANAVSLVDFSGGDRASTPVADQGNLTNQVTTDRGNSSRAASLIAGAYVSVSSSLDPAPAGESVPSDPSSGNNVAPSFGTSKTTCNKKGKNIVCAFKISVSDTDGSIASVGVEYSAAQATGSVALKKKKGFYVASKTFKAKAKKVELSYLAIDNLGLTNSLEATVKVR